MKLKEPLGKFNDWFQADYPRTPSILFSLWIAWLVITDLLNALGFLPEYGISNSQDDNIVVHFVKFQKVNLGDFIVTTGSQFASNDGSLPEEEWCYADREVPVGEYTVNITLATIKGNKPPVYHNISHDSASRLGTTPQELKQAALTHCHFIGG